MPVPWTFLRSRDFAFTVRETAESGSREAPSEASVMGDRSGNRYWIGLDEGNGRSDLSWNLKKGEFQDRKVRKAFGNNIT